jgi:hypothetical protein
MFTTGSKLFLGATALSIAAAVIYGNAKAGAAGWLGVLGLLSAALAFGLLFGVNWYTKDGNVSAMSETATAEAPAARRPAERSVWPALAAIGVGTVAVGAVSKPIVFKAGVVLLLAAAIEWVVRSWSERASADASYNDGLRKRLLHPIEFPVLAAVGLGVLIYSFSRVMLWIDKSAGPAVFVVTGALILFGGFVFASKPSLKKGVVTGVCAIGALGLISTGAVMAFDGQRHIEEHPTTETDNSAACNSAEEGEGDLAEIDHKGSQAVASKASVAMTVVLEDGQLSAYEQGIAGPQNPVTVSRGNTVNLIFKNRDPEKRRLTVNMGEFTEDINGTAVKTRPQVCTTLVRGEDGSQFLTFELAKPSIASSQPYTFTVPGLDDLVPIEIKVP